MGFISLLLAISRAPISRICVTEAVTNSFLPCNNPEDFDEIIVSTGNRIPSLESDPTISDEGQVSYWESVTDLKGRSDATEHLHLSFGNVSHPLLYLNNVLGASQDPMRFRLTRQTSFGQRHLKLWSNHFLLLWPVCFIRQFNGSASRADYFTLRHAFIMANVAEGSSFNFQKFLGRAFDHDFKQVVEISNKNSSVVRGSFVVKPNDEYFWFSRPKWLLHLLQLVMIQNSFQLAFFAWAWFQYGIKSCFNQGTQDFAIRVVMGVIVQLLCGYSTLPLYALVTQMGSGMNSAIFTERVAKGLKFWHHKAKLSLSRQKSVSTIASESGESRVSAVTHRCNEVEEDDPTPEISEKPKAKIKTKGSYVGEISFGNSWRHGHGHGIVIGEIIEEGNKH
ncbi:hypothetical protein V6N13_128870 [Hibiscus sabdariffa]